MALRSVEGQIEEFVEGLMARAFGSGLQPVEIGRRLRRVAVRERQVSVKGRAVAANQYVVELATDDYQRILDQTTTITRDLIEEVRQAATKDGLTFAGPVTVDLVAAEGRRRGTFSIRSSFDDSPVLAQPAVLVTAEGHEWDLGTAGVRIGRHHDNDVVIEESNVSRFHAHVMPIDAGWHLVDNDSTNGTRLNGVFVDRQELADGDRFTVGSATFTFSHRS